MAFDATLTISDGSANHIYSVVDGSKPFACLRQVAPGLTDLDLFERLHIAHREDGKSRITSSKMEFTKVMENTTVNKLGLIKCRVILEIPRDCCVIADVKKVTAQCRALWATSGFEDKFINLES